MTTKTLDRSPIVEDIVIIAPDSDALFEVERLDDLYGEMILVRPMDERDERPAFWTSLTHVKVVDDENPDAWA